MPSENELAGARFQGRHVAQIAAKVSVAFRDRLGAPLRPSPYHSNSICKAQLVDAEGGIRKLKRAGRGQ
jgi:hypothetical protein